MEDIPSIRNCNLENLPENYDDTFYEAHLMNWPSLALIAENSQSQCVGYCLGRIENKYPPRNIQKPIKIPQVVGHVTSVAVNKEYRGRKVAYKLMQTLHTQMSDRYEVDYVSLHVRLTNYAAIKLYSNRLQYTLQEQVSRYYADGEDALLMTLPNIYLKSLNQENNNDMNVDYISS